MAKCKHTEYGLKCGPATIERSTSFASGAIVIEVKTAKYTMDVYVEKTGEIRCFIRAEKIVVKNESV